MKIILLGRLVPKTSFLLMTRERKMRHFFCYDVFKILFNIQQLKTVEYNITENNVYDLSRIIYEYSIIYRNILYINTAKC